MNNEKITVVVNTFKSEDIIQSCLNSIDPGVKVIVVENSNNNEFKSMLETNYSNVKCFLTGDNLGYAKGNNFGLSKVKSQYALILNPDAIIQPGTLNNFLLSAQKLQDFSIMGPAKQDEYNKTNIHKNKNDIFEVDKVKGFAMFLNLNQFKDIGFFDDNFFIYLEETDLCKRLKDERKKIYLNKGLLIEHSGGSSHNRSINFEMELSRNWHWMWSKFYFNKKHYGYLFALLAVSGNFTSSILKYLFYSLTFNKRKKKIYLQRFSGLINSILGKKSWYRPNIIIN